VLDRDDERFSPRARDDEPPQRARLAEVEALLRGAERPADGRSAGA